MKPLHIYRIIFHSRQAFGIVSHGPFALQSFASHIVVKHPFFITCHNVSEIWKFSSSPINPTYAEAIHKSDENDQPSTNDFSISDLTISHNIDYSHHLI